LHLFIFFTYVLASNLSFSHLLSTNLRNGLCNLRKIGDNGDPVLSQDRSLKSQQSNDHTDENDESFTEVRPKIIYVDILFQYSPGRTELNKFLFGKSWKWMGSYSRL